MFDNHLESIIEFFTQTNTQPSQFLLLILQDPHYNHHLIIQDLLTLFPAILAVFFNHLSLTIQMKEVVLKWAKHILEKQCIQEIRVLVRKNTGWHFNARKATTDQLEKFCMKEMAAKYKSDAPVLWDILDTLLDGDLDRSIDGPDTTMNEMDLEGMAKVLFQDKESRASKTRERQKAAIVVHDITPQGLRCSQKLWIKSSLNPTITAVNPRQKQTYKDLLAVISRNGEEDIHQSYNTWKFLHDLCHYGPSYFSRFKSQLKGPPVIKQILVVKPPIIAARAMDINNSTISGNIHAVVDLLAQDGFDVGNESEPEENDLEDYVVLFHGDLGMRTSPGRPTTSSDRGNTLGPVSTCDFCA
ncbi:hypothetical protein SERLA73DRAFT_73133 [Serpula lacrymans var. lacrymans S7.3]|uniref:DUF6589 domain-containing protein n=2 Tax=Serpula lacrymans var. lacrymans TaxID=341189 RepID=F8PU96_SERL3|nr:uncharacterized protein SERLADRAFT_437699 [Serpula lacrymans var. lacrymans S7.9]EGO00409.1 hypothetical protein SERLA73DRAFT_73133 [Serpula lacrymans var. lacrymans S7.3]EGO25965.1 hypothetical protein SERLADRAFT_437699 [Serpula lacrymans var. lacrymans S7.9]